MKIKKILLSAILVGAMTQAAPADSKIDISEETNACELGSAKACLKLGFAYLQEIKTPESEREYFGATEYLKRACMLGSGEGCRFAAVYYIPRSDNDMSEKEGFNYYANKACEQGDSQSCKLIKRREDAIKKIRKKVFSESGEKKESLQDAYNKTLLKK